jgi:hypothetical protein
MLLAVLCVTLFVVLLAGLLWSHQSLKQEHQENIRSDGKLFERAAELGRRAEHSRDILMAYDDVSEALAIMHSLTINRSQEYMKRATGIDVPQLEIVLKEQHQKLRKRITKENPRLRTRSKIPQIAEDEASDAEQDLQEEEEEDIDESEDEEEEEEEEDDEFYVDDDVASSVVYNGPLRRNR